MLQSAASYGLLSAEDNAFRYQRYSGGWAQSDASQAGSALGVCPAQRMGLAGMAGMCPSLDPPSAHFAQHACLNLPSAADEESMGAGEAAGHTRAPAQTSGAQAGGHGHGGHGEEFEFGEVMVHQVGGWQLKPSHPGRLLEVVPPQALCYARAPPAAVSPTVPCLLRR